jgi:hypothetical protein
VKKNQETGLDRLDVDFIGDESPLTLEEEKALSEFFKNQKKSHKGPIRNTVKLNK